MKGTRTAVLGAGALGLTLAYRLAQQGDQVTVIEREPDPGGLAAGFIVARTPDGAPVYLEKFYHHLFRADHAAVNLIEELGLGGRMVWPKPASTILRAGRIHAMDGALPLLRLSVLPFHDRIRVGMVLAPRMGSSRNRCSGRNSATIAIKSPCPGSGRGFTYAAHPWAICAGASNTSTSNSRAR